MALMSPTVIVPVAPVFPDFHVCDRVYGSQMFLTDCFEAAAKLPVGSQMVSYYSLVGPRRPLRYQSNPYALPNMVSSGDCWITVEIGGPSPPNVLSAVPNNIRSAASWIARQCLVVETIGFGGFITIGLAHLTRHVLDLTYDPKVQLPSSTSYLTVTISRHAGLFRPGDTDPSIPLAIMGMQDMELQKLSPASIEYTLRDTDKTLWQIAATGMTRGGEVMWWTGLTFKGFDNTTYECDTALGSPAAVDCTEIEWQQLMPDSDSLEVGPSQVLFLHSETCYLSVSATVALVLSWEQIRVALATLLDTCVQNPYNLPKGGRAYYLPQDDQVRGRKERRQNGRGSISGLNAIPIHANLTVFEQTEAWTSAAEELDTCTWKAVSNRKPVSTCGTH